MTTATGIATPLGRETAVGPEAGRGAMEAARGALGLEAARGATGTLVVGYGNVLRGDDGVGPHVAALLMDDPRLRGATVLARHQLTPELAADVSEARLVVLIDASADDAAGAVRVRRLDGEGAAGSASSHHVEPGDLVALALELWGASPPLYAVTVGAASMDLDAGLSSVVGGAVPRVVDAVAAIVAEHGRA